jgi:hypothetical protein
MPPAALVSGMIQSFAAGRVGAVSGTSATPPGHRGCPLGAAAAAGMAASPLEAQDGDPILIGTNNVGTKSTFLETTSTGFGFYVTALAAHHGVLCDSAGVAIHGSTRSASGTDAGIIGRSEDISGQAPEHRPTTPKGLEGSRRAGCGIGGGCDCPTRSGCARRCVSRAGRLARLRPCWPRSGTALARQRLRG